MKKACYLKFAQNPMLLDHLLSTGEKTIIEASNDVKWGVGVHLSRKNVFDSSKWNGENRLGHILMDNP